MKGIQIKTLLKRHNAVLGLIFMIIPAVCTNRNLLTPKNLANVLRQASMNGMIAIEMIIVIIYGPINLSVGIMIGLYECIALYLSSYSLILAMIVPSLIGIIAGTIDGLLVNKIRIVPFTAILITMMAVKGAALVLTNENTHLASNSIEQFQYIGRGLLAPYITVPSVMFICCTVAGVYIFGHTMPGRNMYAVGGNTEVARMMEVDVERTLMFSHIFTGGVAVLTGITLISRVGAAYPLAGEGEGLDVITACVIGRTALIGGKGHISDTFIGVLIMGMLANIFDIQSLLNPFWEKVTISILVLIVVPIQSADESGVTFGKNVKTLMRGKMQNEKLSV